MPVFAVGLEDALQAAILVLSRCHRFQVIRVYARSVPAQVVDGQSARDFTNPRDVGRPVDSVILVLDGDSSVAPVRGALPLPTSVLFDDTAELYAPTHVFCRGSEFVKLPQPLNRRSLGLVGGGGHGEGVET